MTAVLSYVKQQAASAFERFKRITKDKNENGEPGTGVWEQIYSGNL